MNGRDQSHDRVALRASASVGAFFRFIASILLLAWVIPDTAPVPSGLGQATAQASLASIEPFEHPTLAVRDLARAVGAETSRSKKGAYAPIVEKGGKPLGIVPGVQLPREEASGIPFNIWPEHGSKLLPLRAFDARGPPTRPA